MISFLVFGLTVFMSPVSAQTVAEDMYLKSRISKAQEVSFEALSAYFSENQQFTYKCVSDSLLNRTSNWEDIQTFMKYLNPKSQGTLNIKIDEREFGFDLTFEKSDILKSNPDIYTIKSSLHCDGGGDSGGCSSLSSESEWEFQFSAFGVEDKNYADSAKRYETWKIYFVDDEIYATHAVNYEARELGWMGQPKQWYTYSRNEVCQLSVQK